MKKEYLILTLLILGLGSYLFLKKENQVNYELPALAPLEATTMDKLEIHQKGDTLVLQKQDKGWTVGQYPAAQTKVDEVLDAVKGLGLSALVSESQDLVRYDLDKETRIQVTAWSGQKVVREFFIGKTAPSLNHTFVMLDQDPRVFQADKNFRSAFDKSADDFRDKLVLEFKTGEVKAITLVRNGIEKTLTPLPAKGGKKEETQEGQGDKPEVQEAGKAGPAWQDQDAAPVSRAEVEDLLASISRLECKGFLGDDQAPLLKDKTPGLAIRIQTQENLSLSLFDPKEADADAQGISSFTPYAFTLENYKTKDILGYAEQILGIEPEAKAADKE